jgi:hypothetical protein
MGTNQSQRARIKSLSDEIAYYRRTALTGGSVYLDTRYNTIREYLELKYGIDGDRLREAVHEHYATERAKILEQRRNALIKFWVVGVVAIWLLARGIYGSSCDFHFAVCGNVWLGEPSNGGTPMLVLVVIGGAALLFRYMRIEWRRFSAQWPKSPFPFGPPDEHWAYVLEKLLFEKEIRKKSEFNMNDFFMDSTRVLNYRFKRT